MNKKHILLDIAHTDAPLGLGLILGNLGHAWYVPSSINWTNVTRPLSPCELREHVTERHLACGAQLYYDPAQLKDFDLVITGRWEKYRAIRRALSGRTHLGYYTADRFCLFTRDLPNVIGGIKKQPNTHYFLKRVPEYWFDKYLHGDNIISMVNHLEKYEERWSREWWHEETVLHKALMGLWHAGCNVRRYGIGNPDGWIYDQVAYRLMRALLHIKSWGSGSDWSVLKACARGIPCIVYKRYVTGTTHEDILDPSSNVFLTRKNVEDQSWIPKLMDITGEGNRERLKTLYQKAIPESQVAEYLKSVFG